MSQVTLRLKAIENRDQFAATVDNILRWMNKRAGQTLPEAAWQRQSFELSEIGAQRTAAVALKEPKYWAARLDDADKTVPLRTWVTEIGVGVDVKGDVLFGVRLVCATRGVDEPFDRSVPGFVKSILSSGVVELDGVVLEKEPRFVQSEDDVANLVALLESADRQADVVVFSLPEGSENFAETAASSVRVHAKLYGVAHVVVIDGPASFMLTDAVGRELSVFRQAVRVYRPGFRSWLDDSSKHPLILPKRIAGWEDGGSIAFERWISNQLLAGSVRGRERRDRLPSFNVVRQHAAQAEMHSLRNAGGSDAEILKLYEQDNDQLRTELKEQKEQYDGLLAAADVERDALVQGAEAARAQALERLHRIRILEGRLKQHAEHREIAIPESLDQFEDWCNENLTGAVELVGRAFQGVRKSNYYDPQFIYRSLLLLRDHYVPMRIGGSSERRQAYQDALNELELEESPTGDGINYAADLYSVQYGAVRRSLDRHLKGRNSRDRRFGFRLYFFWDEEEQMVVVGWLPSHLNNRAS
ncbi:MULTISPECIES: hypothetical protein [unclassified Variovorax]|uniref:hypothetical protein n=1 Tax=unclassified Variovorax TaxID=663243 RepID=UPI0034E942DC